MADDFDALSSFNTVRGDVDLGADDIIAYLKGAATDAIALANVSFPAAPVTPNKTAITAPTEPDKNDAALFTGATDFLDWLYTQQLQAATFPDYATLFPDEPPAAPGIDTANPRTFTIETVAKPEYVVPVWDDGSAWSGGDLSQDPSLGVLTAPFVWVEQSYTSQLLQGGKNLLYDLVKRDLESSDFGIDALDDGRLWDRAREREDRAMAGAVGDAVRLFSTGGFPMPTGAAQAAINKIQSEARDKVLSLNREIMSKKADLYLEAKKVAVANGLEVEKTTMNFYNSEADRLLKRLTQEITATIEVANFNIERIKLMIEKYKTYAQAFSAQVEGATGIVKMYEAEVGAEGTKANANKAIYDALSSKNKAVIDGFVAQLQGFQTVMDARVKYHGVLADVYKTQVGQANTIAEISKGAYDLVDKQQKNLVDYRVGKYNGDVTRHKAEVDEIVAYLNTAIEGLKAKAQSQTTLATASLSALNVNLGMSVSANASVGGSETHQYDQTKGKDSGVTKSESTQNYYDKTKSSPESEKRSYSESHNYEYKVV